MNCASCGRPITACERAGTLLLGGELAVRCAGYVHDGDGWHLCDPAADWPLRVAAPA